MCARGGSTHTRILSLARVAQQTWQGLATWHLVWLNTFGAFLPGYGSWLGPWIHSNARGAAAAAAWTANSAAQCIMHVVDDRSRARAVPSWRGGRRLASVRSRLCPVLVPAERLHAARRPRAALPLRTPFLFWLLLPSCMAAAISGWIEIWFGLLLCDDFICLLYFSHSSYYIALKSALACFCFFIFAHCPLPLMVSATCVMQVFISFCLQTSN